MNEETTCRSCGKSVTMILRDKIFSNGIKHVERWCPSCGAFNAYQEQEINQETASSWIMPFGKHKGDKIVTIPDDYIGWAVENLNGSIKKRFLGEANRRKEKDNGPTPKNVDPHRKDR